MGRQILAKTFALEIATRLRAESDLETFVVEVTVDELDVVVRDSLATPLRPEIWIRVPRDGRTRELAQEGYSVVTDVLEVVVIHIDPSEDEHEAACEAIVAALEYQTLEGASEYMRFLDGFQPVPTLDTASEQVSIGRLTTLYDEIRETS